MSIYKNPLNLEEFQRVLFFFDTCLVCVCLVKETKLQQILTSQSSK